MLELGVALAALGSAGCYHQAAEVPRRRWACGAGSLVAFATAVLLSKIADPTGLSAWVVLPLWWLGGLTGAVLMRPLAPVAVDRSSFIAVATSALLLAMWWGG